MGINAAPIAVYPVSIFGSAKDIWVGSLKGILEFFPALETPHKQSFYMLLYIKKAEGVCIIDNASIRLEQQKIIFIKPNSVFSLDINRNAEGYCICFTESFFSLRYNNNVLHQFNFLGNNSAAYIRLKEAENEKWLLLIKQMSKEFNSQIKDAEKVLRSYVNILLHDLDRHDTSKQEKILKGNKNSKLIAFEQMLESQYMSSKAPSVYAQQLHISTNYLNKLCHEQYGISSGMMIRNRIVLEAQRLLYYTPLSVSEIAYKLGFESPSYFITLFKKMSGHTPENFRKINN